MDRPELVATNLPKAVIASVIILLFDIYTEGIASPVRLGTEFLAYTIAIFAGFVVLNLILEAVPEDGEL